MLNDGYHDVVVVVPSGTIGLAPMVADAGGVGDEAWTCDSSVRHHGCSMVADASGVGGEAWTCDGQTNGINFIQFVCPSPRLLNG